MNNDVKKLISCIISILVCMILLAPFQEERYFFRWIFLRYPTLFSEDGLEYYIHTILRHPTLVLVLVIGIIMILRIIRAIRLLVRIAVSGGKSGEYSVHSYKSKQSSTENYTKVNLNEKDRYVEQLNTLLQSGIINREEYLRLRERYDRRP